VAVVEASAHSSAPRDAVWAVVADLRGWKDWGPWEVTDLLEEGSPDPNGEGALRRIRASQRSMGRRPWLKERVNVFEPPMRFGYTLVSGVPLKDYQATITLTEAGEGTEIVWRLEFEGKFPGAAAMARSALEPFLKDVTGRIAREAERR
jgi:polyketide cyclase/dehydrase/lipid transport protein